MLVKKTHVISGYLQVPEAAAWMLQKASSPSTAVPAHPENRRRIVAVGIVESRGGDQDVAGRICTGIHEVMLDLKYRQTTAHAPRAFRRRFKTWQPSIQCYWIRIVMIAELAVISRLL